MKFADEAPDDGSLGGFDDPESFLAAETPSLKATSWGDDDVADLLQEEEEKAEASSKNKKKGSKKSKVSKSKKSQPEYTTSKEDMMSVFGFQQGSCDFCLQFVKDDTIGQLQMCMCNKKYFCKDCLKNNKLVAAHQQECAQERFERLQKKRERRLG